MFGKFIEGRERWMNGEKSAVLGLYKSCVIMLLFPIKFPTYLHLRLCMIIAIHNERMYENCFFPVYHRRECECLQLPLWINNLCSPLYLFFLYIWYIISNSTDDIISKVVCWEKYLYKDLHIFHDILLLFLEHFLLLVSPCSCHSVFEGLFLLLFFYHSHQSLARSLASSIYIDKSCKSIYSTLSRTYSLSLTNKIPFFPIKNFSPLFLR